MQGGGEQGTGVKGQELDQVEHCSCKLGGGGDTPRSLLSLLEEQEQ